MGGSAGKNALLNNEIINRIAQKYSISPAQVLLRWAVQRNYGKLSNNLILKICYEYCKFEKIFFRNL